MKEAKQTNDTEDRKRRKKYWNEDYCRYWQARVREANESPSSVSTLVQGDTLTTTDKNYFTAIELLDIKQGSVILEMGCGFGRSLPHLHNKTKNVHAIDISESMISAAREACAEYEGIDFKVSDAESTPFPSEMFDHIICYAVFDALYQKEALLEMNRIAKTGATLLITGKNDNYFDDDHEALVAERNARRKGHPNYFTDVAGLLGRLKEFGFTLTEQRYFLRRGDDHKEKFVTSIPEHFYEYMIVLKKETDKVNSIDFDIAHQFSKTFRRQKLHED